VLRFKAVPEGYDPTDRQKVTSYLAQQPADEIVTGLLFVDESVKDLHEMNQTSEIPFARMPFEKLCPGAAALDRLQEEFC
jgi:2-oxoglutarate/2-oxoacid ferredoxin oxidoreductase subunit beta